MPGAKRNIFNPVRGSFYRAKMRIDALKQKYKDEWLLIQVKKTDELNQPIDGELIAHSKSRDEIYARMKKVRGHTYTLYTGRIPEKGYAVAFDGKIAV